MKEWGGQNLGEMYTKQHGHRLKEGTYLQVKRFLVESVCVCVCGSKNSPLIPEPHGTDGIHRLSQHQQQERVNPPLFVQYALLSRTKYTVKVLLKITRKEIPPLTIC